MPERDWQREFYQSLMDAARRQREEMHQAARERLRTAEPGEVIDIPQGASPVPVWPEPYIGMEELARATSRVFTTEAVARASARLDEAHPDWNQRATYVHPDYCQPEETPMPIKVLKKIQFTLPLTSKPDGSVREFTLALQSDDVVSLSMKHVKDMPDMPTCSCTLLRFRYEEENIAMFSEDIQNIISMNYCNPNCQTELFNSLDRTRRYQTLSTDLWNQVRVAVMELALAAGVHRTSLACLSLYQNRSFLHSETNPNEGQTAAERDECYTVINAYLRKMRGSLSYTQLISRFCRLDRCGSCSVFAVKSSMVPIEGVWFCPACAQEQERERRTPRCNLVEENHPQFIGHNTADRFGNHRENVLDYKKGFLVSSNPLEEKNPIMLGIELELESRRCYEDGARFIHETMGQYAISKYDGTLRDQVGLEVVCVPGTLLAHKEIIWKKFFESKPYRALTAWYARGCGMHIHISMKHITDLELGKMVRFVNAVENKGFIDLIAGRPASQWCMRDGLKRINSGIRKERNHYDALSFSGHTGRTAELRIFRSNISPLGFWKNVEFAHALVQFAKSGVPITRLQTKRIRTMDRRQNSYPIPFPTRRKAQRRVNRVEPSFHEFLRWLQKPNVAPMYPNLVKFLEVRGKLTPKHKPKPGTAPLTEASFVDFVDVEYLEGDTVWQPTTQDGFRNSGDEQPF